MKNLNLLYITLFSTFILIMCNSIAYAGCIYNHGAVDPLYEYEATTSSSTHNVIVTCKVCGGEQYISLGQHSFSTYFATSYIAGKCWTNQCTLCGYRSSSWADHAEMKKTIEKEATCTATGITKYTCSSDKYHTYKETVPKNPNNHSGTTTTTTYKSKDENKHEIIETYNCCGAEKSRTEVEHNFGATTVTKAATCTVSGSSTATCGDCGYVKTTVIAALGHKYGVYVANGTSGHRRQCSVCSTYENTVPHKMSSNLVLSLNDETKHCYRCSVCLYESNVASHTYTIKEYKYDTSLGKYVHIKWCNTCKLSELAPEECSFTSKITKKATCTTAGNTRYTCSVCNQYYDEEIAKLSHTWSAWQTSSSEHWKSCTLGCGAETSRGMHSDTNPKDGYCDECNYLMYIAPEIEISPKQIEVKADETAVFSINLKQGTAPITYQWYYKEANSTTGNLISGETGTTLSVTATKNMNGRSYYCVAKNLGGQSTSDESKLTVFYPFTIKTQPKDITVKKDETATFLVEIGDAGNPNSYEYQWYVASSDTSNGSRLKNATGPTYTVKPTKNIVQEYYYCVITNEKYTISSARAKFAADITEPIISAGEADTSSIINGSIIKIPVIVTDTGVGYIENGNNFKADSINVKVGGITNTSVSKTLNYIGSEGNNHEYELILQNLSGNGKLSLVVSENAAKDIVGNGNSYTEIDKIIPKKLSAIDNNYEIVIDNTPPVINFEEVISGVNGKYANSQDKIEIEVSILEAGGMDPNEFKEEDLIIKVAGIKANEDLIKTVEYIEKVGNKYIYKITLNNIKGEGALSINIPADKIKDYARNYNLNTEKIVQINGENVIIDNTKPVISDLVAKLEDYNSSKNYPSNLDPHHNGWSNQDIYMTVTASDTGEIDYYMSSVGGTTNFEKMSSNKEIISESVNDKVYYRVVDKAGNYADIYMEIKLDKVLPEKPKMSLFLERNKGAIYEYDANRPTDKAVYIIPDDSTIVDKGPVKSGIDTDITYTYYTKTMYKDPTKTEQIGSVKTYPYNGNGISITENGYYEFVMKTTDIAGNTIVGDVYKVYIAKKAENTIRLTNINDIGSGTKKVTIRVYKGDLDGNKLSEEAIEPIFVEDVYKEVIKNVRLGSGTYYIEVTLEDKVGNTVVLEEKIQNNL